MKKITDKGVKEIVNRCFGRHKDIEAHAKQLSLHTLVKIILIVWEARYPFSHYK